MTDSEAGTSFVVSKLMHLLRRNVSQLLTTEPKPWSTIGPWSEIPDADTVSSLITKILEAVSKCKCPLSEDQSKLVLEIAPWLILDKKINMKCCLYLVSDFLGFILVKIQGKLGVFLRTRKYGEIGWSTFIRVPLGWKVPLSALHKKEIAEERQNRSSKNYILLS